MRRCQSCGRGVDRGTHCELPERPCGEHARGAARAAAVGEARGKGVLAKERLLRLLVGHEADYALSHAVVETIKRQPHDNAFGTLQFVFDKLQQRVHYEAWEWVGRVAFAADLTLFDVVCEARFEAIKRWDLRKSLYEVDAEVQRLCVRPGFAELVLHAERARVLARRILAAPAGLYASGFEDEERMLRGDYRAAVARLSREPVVADLPYDGDKIAKVGDWPVLRVRSRLP